MHATLRMAHPRDYWTCHEFGRVGTVCAVIPFNTGNKKRDAQQARKLAAFWNLTPEQQVDKLAYGDLLNVCGFRSNRAAEVALAAITGGRT
jgi:hypothetical protein